jgi:hypothetical protein
MSLGKTIYVQTAAIQMPMGFSVFHYLDSTGGSSIENTTNSKRGSLGLAVDVCIKQTLSKQVV